MHLKNTSGPKLDSKMKVVNYLDAISNPTYLPLHKMKFSVKDVFSTCDQTHSAAQCGVHQMKYFNKLGYIIWRHKEKVIASKSRKCEKMPSNLFKRLPL